MNPKHPKPIQGQRPPLWQRLNLREHPTVPCGFKIGDRVEYTNDNGVKFDDEIVIGFANDANFYGRFIHLSPGLTEAGEPRDAWWFPHKPSDLRLTKAAEVGAQTLGREDDIIEVNPTPGPAQTVRLAP